MTCTQKFYHCKHCGNFVGMLISGGVPMMCCGEKMEEAVPNTVDAAKEKHLPEATINGSLVEVKVGSIPHPMLDEHYIQWVYLQTTEGGHRKCLTSGIEPKVVFALTDGEQPIAVYEHCNLHGLWKAEID